MSKFTLKKIEAIQSKQEFVQLEINGVACLDLFEKTLLEKMYQSEYRTILTYMEYLGNGGVLPDKKFKNITPEKELVSEFEFKSKHLRIYCIQKLNGKIVILAGQKNTQPKDIRKFRAIKREYLNSLKYPY